MRELWTGRANSLERDLLLCMFELYIDMMILFWLASCIATICNWLFAVCFDVIELQILHDYVIVDVW